MPNDPEQRLSLRQADQARTDFAIIESDLEFLMQRIAQLPYRRGSLAGDAVDSICIGGAWKRRDRGLLALLSSGMQLDLTDEEKPKQKNLGGAHPWATGRGV